MRSDSNNWQVVVFLDDLGLVSGLRLLALALRSRVVEVRYLTSSRAGRLVLSLLRRLRPRLAARRIDLDFSSQMPEGGGLWYWVQVAVEDVAKSMAAGLAGSGSYMDRVSPKIAPARRAAFLRKSLSRQLYRPMVLALLARREATDGATPARRAVFVRVSDLLPLFAGVSRQWTGDITFINLPQWRDPLPVRLLWFAREQVAVLGWALLQGISRTVQPRRKRGGAPPPSVALEYGMELDGGVHGSDLPWYKLSGLDRSRCVMFMPSGTRELKGQGTSSSEVVKRVKATGLRFAFLDRGAVPGTHAHQSPTRMARRVLLDVISLARALAWARKVHAPWWQLNRWLTVLVWLRRWQSFMEAENVKVIFDYSEVSLDVAALAADVVGAVKLGYFWGDFPVPFAGVSPVQQVQFIWGRRYRAIWDEMGAAASVLLEAGNTFDDGEARREWLQKAQTHRARLEGAGVKHVLGVFDRSCSSNSLCPPAYHVEFYGKLLSWAESDPGLGLLVKPKSHGGPGVFVYEPELGKRLDALVDGGRAIVLHGRQHPAEAALASDVVVALGLNSAGVLSALEGVRTVFWDPAQAHTGPSAVWLHGPMWEQGRVVFDRMDGLIDLVRGFFERPDAFPSSGDLSPALDEIDGFRDGQTARRIGSFARWFMEGLDQGLDRPAALQGAVDRYAAAWGGERVCSRI